MKAAIDDGRIGAPGLATVEVLGWRSPEYYAMNPWRGTREGEGGGVLVNQAVHQLDLACWFLGPAAEVDGWTANLNHPEIEVEDTAVAVVRFVNGALASIVASNSQRPGLHARIHVHGRNGASVGVETDRGSSFVAGPVAAERATQRPVDDPGRGGRAGALGRRGPRRPSRASTSRPITTSSSCATSSGRSARVAGRRSAGRTGGRPSRLMAAIDEASRTGGRVRLESDST